ncbi:MAG: ABC transporter ATP-binding protein [Planctomycetes bacterium]|nr:ABC transporter ATP-binding protein [Planctomycetota bacterium]
MHTRPSTMETILEARDLYRFHEVRGDRVPILRGASFTLTRGSFTTIMGPSGSGKSTLLHLLAGLDVPSAGDVLLCGESLSHASEARRTALRRRSIGFVFQFFNLLPDLTVRENVELPLMIQGRAPRRAAARIDELLGLLGVAHLHDRLPSGLSGGEMQRVSIVRALAGDAPLLLADEPTGNLSSKAGEEVVTLLRDVVARLGTTVLLVTHNPRDAAMGDRVLFLNDGTLDVEHALTGSVSVHDVHARLEQLGI